MKKAVATVMIMHLVLAFLIVSAEATPISINFMGPGLNLLDTNADGFSETLSFGTAYVTSCNPMDDALFGDSVPFWDWEQIVFSDVTLSTLSYISGKVYYFNPLIYAGGFKVYDDDSSLLLSADLTLHSLEVNSSTGRINSNLQTNLMNISSPISPGVSTIVDQFINSPVGGAMNLTFQISGDLGSAIELGNEIENITYSGSASPVPEPASCLLLLFGLIGIAGIKRKCKD